MSTSQAPQSYRRGTEDMARITGRVNISNTVSMWLDDCTADDLTRAARRAERSATNAQNAMRRRGPFSRRKSQKLTLSMVSGHVDALFFTELAKVLSARDQGGRLLKRKHRVTRVVDVDDKRLEGIRKAATREALSRKQTVTQRSA